MPGSLRDDTALFRDHQGAADVAKSAKKEVQTDEKAQLARPILKGVGLETLWPQALALLGWGVVILTLAYTRSSKRLA